MVLEGDRLSLQDSVVCRDIPAPHAPGLSHPHDGALRAPRNVAAPLVLWWLLVCLVPLTHIIFPRTFAQEYSPLSSLIGARFVPPPWKLSSPPDTDSVPFVRAKACQRACLR